MKLKNRSQKSPSQKTKKLLPLSVNVFLITLLKRTATFSLIYTGWKSSKTWPMLMQYSLLLEEGGL